MRWLVISPYLPHPGIGHGGGTAVLQLLTELAQHHQTTLLCFEREDEAGRQDWLRARGVEVRTIPWRSDQARGLARIGLIADRARVLLGQHAHDRPLMVEKYDRAELRRAVDRILDEHPFDVVQVEYSFLSPVARHARAHPSHPVVLLNTHEIASLPRQREVAAARDPIGRARAAKALQRAITHEQTLPSCADRVLCVTPQDREHLAAHLGADAGLATIPLGYDLAGIGAAHTHPLSPPRLLFVGSFGHPPNARAARVLVEEVMPLVHAIRPGIGLDLVGRGASSALADAAVQSRGRIRVYGFVPDLDQLFAGSTIVVAPLFSGGGIKIKVLEAMARGACLVSTPIGVEGIDDAGEACALGSTAADLAQLILELTEDEDRRRTLGRAARAKIEQGFSWPAIVRRLEDEARTVRAQSTSG